MCSEKTWGDFLKSSVIEEIIETGRLMAERGWAERNAGNISLIIPPDEASKYFDLNKTGRIFRVDMDIRELSGKIILVTRTGMYFRKLKKNTASDLGVLKVSENSNELELLWGFEGGGEPTSELPMHLMGHIARLRRDPSHRVITHTHATDIIAMSAMEGFDEKGFTRALWQMHSECLIVFPDGIGLLPWMVPGTCEIAEATAEKFNSFRLIVWPLHGVIGTGSSIDEAMGLIETVEKTAEIYLKSAGTGRPVRLISDEQLIALAEYFNIKPASGIIDGL